jgi:hypothetical protein
LFHRRNALDYFRDSLGARNSSSSRRKNTLRIFVTTFDVSRVRFFAVFHRDSKTRMSSPRGQRSDIGTPADGPASPRDAARPTSPPRTRARRPRSRTRVRRQPRPSQALVAPGRQGRAVAPSAPRPRASFKSPPRKRRVTRPWRFRGITCSGCSRARPAWAAGRSAADSLPWAPRRSRTSRGTSRCRVRARARRPDGEKYFYARHANPKSSSIRRVRRRESDRRLAVRPHPRAARESLSPARETRNAKREKRKTKRVVLTPR